MILPSPNLGEEQSSPYLLVLGIERVRIVAECLAELDSAERALLLLHYVDSEGLAEIGRCAGVSASAVSQMHRGVLDGLRARLIERGLSLRDLLL